MKEIRIMFNRIRRLMLLLQKWNANFYNVLYWEYPRHSALCFAITLVSIILFESEYTLSIGVLLVLFIVYRNSRFWAQTPMEARFSHWLYGRRN